jgi:hypothetical protein
VGVERRDRARERHRRAQDEHNPERAPAAVRTGARRVTRRAQARGDARHDAADDKQRARDVGPAKGPAQDEKGDDKGARDHGLLQEHDDRAGHNVAAAARKNQCGRERDEQAHGGAHGGAHPPHLIALPQQDGKHRKEHRREHGLEEGQHVGVLLHAARGTLTQRQGQRLQHRIGRQRREPHQAGDQSCLLSLIFGRHFYFLKKIELLRALCETT